MRAVARRISRIAGAVFAFLTVNFSAGLPSFAQLYTRTNISQAAIDIEVIDPAGAPVPDADVILNEPSRKQKLYGKTDKHGMFALAGVRSGQYELTVSAPGLLSFPETVDLRSGEKLSLSMKLNFGLVGEIVTIDGLGISVDSVPVNIAPLPLTSAGPKPMQR
jgi:hypothetical protein